MQENDGLDMPTLFSSAKDLLGDLDSMKDDPETAQDALDINPQLAKELEQLFQMTQNELACKPSPYFPRVLSGWTNEY